MYPLLVERRPNGIQVFFQSSGCGKNEAMERWTRGKRATQELRMKLTSDVVGVDRLGKFRDFHAFTRLVTSHQREACGMNSIYLFRVHFVAMSVTFHDFRRTIVEELRHGHGAIGVGVSKLGFASPETHCSSHSSLVDFRHEDDNRLCRIFVELG